MLNFKGASERTCIRYIQRMVVVVLHKYGSLSLKNSSGLKNIMRLANS